ncbi:MAG: ABC transporter ATP-binding protein [Bacteriovoracaceae bacterium]|nr:ABC transporter ATP-binding protein [Bacteriovoracaceae bacterium]
MADKSEKYIHEDEQDETKLKRNALSDLKSFLFLFSFFKNAKRDFITGISITLIAPVFSMLGATLLGLLVQDGLIKKNYKTALWLGAAFIGTEILMVLFTYVGSRLIVTGASVAILDIRKVLFDKLQVLPMRFFDRQPQGRIITRITHDVREVEQFFIGTFGRLVSGIFSVFVAVIFMYGTNVRLAHIMVLSIIPAIVFMLMTRKFIRRFNRKRSKHSSRLNSKLSEYIDGIGVIRLFGLENWSKKNYDDIADDFVAASLEGNVVMSWTQPTLSLLTFVPLAGLVYFGGQSVMAGTLSVAIFVAFFHYSQRFISPILQLVRQIHVIQQAYTGAERVFAFLNHEREEDALGKDGTLTTVLAGEVEFKNVVMAYETAPILKNLSFTIKAGEKIGFVGRTGCGKTTIVGLLSRLYDFQEGDISLDGQGIRSICRSHLRHSIGYVSQDVIIFKGSLRDNLLAGSSHVEHAILDACRETGLYRVMLKNQIDLDTLIYEGGSNLSVGERQLVSLTRVLLSDPSILILDEATANIDPEYEEIIHKAVYKIMNDRTCIMIAHRLDTLSKTDRIFVFDSGELVEEGPIRELMNKKGLFHKLQSHNEL